MLHASTMRLHRPLAVVVLGFAMHASVEACVSHARPGPDVYGYAVQPATKDRAIIERAPRVYYRGAWAHYVDGHWHYPTTSGWVVFVEEPIELSRQRDAMGTEQSETNMPSPRGPSVHQSPGVSGPLAIPPANVE